MLPEIFRLDAWRKPLVMLSISWLALLIAFWRDWTAMADQWWNSSTYNHILLIPLIIAWLFHQRLRELIQIVPGGWWPGLLGFTGAVLLWVLGSCASVALVTQLAAVAMLITVALAILGPHAGAALAFPLGYMLLLVPFGDELVGPMQMITAAITVWLVHLSGIKAIISGVFIDTPAGLFEVAEACSGVKFLVAMFAFAVLVANVCFISWARRIAFIALALSVSILANGLRAWGTIYAAQYIGAERAGGIDHLIYGWVFFGIVIAATLALGWRFFDRAADAALIDPKAINGSALLRKLAAARSGAKAALLIVAALVIGGRLWVSAADSLAAPLPKQVFLAEVPGWQRVDYAPREWWEPRASGADHRLLGRYRNSQGQTVDVFYALYASQGPGRKAAGFGEGALRPESDWSWLSSGPTVLNAKSERLRAVNKTVRLAETYFRTGQLTTGANTQLSLALMQDRLLLRARPTMMLILSAEEHGDHSAESIIAAFRQSVGPAGQWMDRIAQLR
jgi:exosortase A